MKKHDEDVITKALQKNRQFLAYLKANALLHDLDKLTAEFLRWSIFSPEAEVEDYPGHNSYHLDRYNFLSQKSDLFGELKPNSLKVNMPVSKVAMEPQRLEALYQKNLEGLLKEKDFTDCQDHFENKNYPWQRSVTSGKSLFDLYGYHHDPEIYLKTSVAVPTSLLFFAAQVAGIDGHDTKYEVEADQSNQSINHTPIINGDKVLIATPFGHETEVAIDKATESAENAKLSEQIDLVCREIAANSDPFPAVTKLEDIIKKTGQHTVIRTGRPVNDVTLADHAVSTAALTMAHGARIAIEGYCSPPDAYYAVPVRASHLADDNPSCWPTTGFAIFSCAVNNDRLDAMAMDLPDITAIRKEVQHLFDLFSQKFTRENPLGGEVYRDQHAIHLVVPLLGDPTKRWLEKDADAKLKWLPPNDNNLAISNSNLQDWLFTTAKQFVAKGNFHFDQELLIAFRYARIGDRLNKLAEAIAWSREIAGLGSGMDKTTELQQICFLNYHKPQMNPGIKGELCCVCGLRFQDKNNSRRKCQICADRVKYRPAQNKEETIDLTDIAAGSEDNRLALVSIAFDLSPWLEEEINSGIFCWNKDWPATPTTRYTNQKQYKKLLKLQRLNSFGRFRRIWRTSEDFLKIQCAKAQQLTTIGNDKKAKMRTILQQPQNLQIIMPSKNSGPFLDQLIDDFYTEFGRVASRVAINIAVLLFPFRVPIYLILEADRVVKRWALSNKLSNAEFQKQDENFSIRRDLEGRNFQSLQPLPFEMKYQPAGSNLGGLDRIYANIQLPYKAQSSKKKCRQKPPENWRFIGDLNDSTPVKMVANRICLAEINSGFVLNRLAKPSPERQPSFSHDFPLEHWPRLHDFLELERPISATKRRKLRAELALREQIWADNSLSLEQQRLFCELLLREPGRYSAETWLKMSDEDQNLLINSCLNGGIYMASLIRKHLYVDTEQL